MAQKFLIWTGGGTHDPENAARAAAIPPLPAPDSLPRAAVITYWWGPNRFEVAAVGCSLRTTPWGAGQMTWLHCNQTQTSAIGPHGSSGMIRLLVPAHYVTDIQPGPGYQIQHRYPSDDTGLFPPSHPAPADHLSLAAIRRALAGLADAPADAAWKLFSVSYPVFALKLKGGGYVGFDAPPGAAGPRRAVPVFTDEAMAEQFLERSKERGRVEAFDRVPAFRRFLRSLRDAGTVILFDPVPDDDGRLRAAHECPAAVVLEQFLPPIVWGWTYPLYLLQWGDGFACAAAAAPDGRRVSVLSVFTDSDLADRAVEATPHPMTAVPVPDGETFGRLARGLPAEVWGVVFDPPVRGRAKTAIPRDTLIANLDDMEL